jgi:hypothetical protein
MKPISNSTSEYLRAHAEIETEGSRSEPPQCDTEIEQLRAEVRLLRAKLCVSDQAAGALRADNLVLRKMLGQFTKAMP